MGRRLLAAAGLENYARAAAVRLRSSSAGESSSRSPAMAASKGSSSGASEEKVEKGVPLADVVSDCAHRWFQDALKEARAGDAAMQVLVSQMYRFGYGVPKNEQKARVWIDKASRYRLSALRVRNKRPGYNASDSDSDEDNENTK